MAPAEETAVSAETLLRMVVQPPIENRHFAKEKFIMSPV